MKTHIKQIYLSLITMLMVSSLLVLATIGYGQDDQQDAQKQNDQVQQAAQSKPSVRKPVKNTFESIWMIDNQTVMVPVKGSFEMDIMHRFGTLKNGYSDFFGFFAPSNIRLGFEYVPIKNLLVGASLTKFNMTAEGYAKYALLRETKGLSPVSVTYYVDMAIETREKNNYRYDPSDRFMYFHQLLIAKKITEKWSVQVAPSLTHVNSVNGYFTGDTTLDGKNVVAKEMRHDHFAVAVSMRYKVSPAMAIIADYDQPLTKHAVNNPSPNISAGIEINTSGHTFQVFLGNYYFITPSRNNYYNTNNPIDWRNSKDDWSPNPHFGSFLIGFNITRLWNF